MRLYKNITIYTLSLLYIIVGVKHFTNTDFFMAIVPKYIKWPQEAVLISGFAEIILGLFLLHTKTRKIASWGIIFLLLAVFPANIYLYISESAREILEITKVQSLIRMPFQAPLIILAYWHSKEHHSEKFSIICSLLFIPTIIYFILL